MKFIISTHTSWFGYEQICKNVLIFKSIQALHKTVV